MLTSIQINVSEHVTKKKKKAIFTYIINLTSVSLKFVSIVQTGCNQEAGKYHYKLQEVLRTMSRHWLNCAGIWRRCWADITAAVLPCWVAEGQHFAKFACDSCAFWYSSETHCRNTGQGWERRDPVIFIFLHLSLSQQLLHVLLSTQSWP